MTRRTILTAAIAIFFTLFLACRPQKGPTTVRLAVEGDPQAKAILEKLLKAHPMVKGPGQDMEYSIIIVQPNPNIDYKIAQVMPDTKIDYKIIIVDPTTHKQVSGMSKALEEALQKGLKEEKKKPVK